MRAFLYARVSRDPKQRGRSTDAQLTEGRRYCEAQGWTIAGEYVDIDRSASRHARKPRPDYDAMVRDVQAGNADVIVSWEASRLHRDLAAYAQLRDLCLKHGVLWCYDGNVFDMSKRSDRKVTAQDAIQAEDESEGIRERVLRTMRLRAEAGQPTGRILYGYMRRYDPDTGDLIGQFPHPEHADIVRRMFREFAAGTSIYRIQKNLNADGITTRTGKPWLDVTIRAALGNPGYVGRRIHQGRDIGPATWEALIDELTWHRVQGILNDPTRARMKDSRTRHLLSGIAICGPCGGKLRVLKNRGIVSYVCEDNFCVAIKKDNLEAYVEQKVVRKLENPSSAEVFDPAPQEGVIAAALAEEARLVAELEEARTAAKNGTLSVASLIAVESGVLARIKKVRASMADLGVPPLLADLAGKPDADKRWNALPLEEQRSVLRAIANVTVNGGLRGSSKIADGRVQVRLGIRNRS